MTGRSLRRSMVFMTGTRLVLNTAYRFVYPFLPEISRGLGISLEQGGLLVSARSLVGMATPAVVATAGRGGRRYRLIVVALAMFAVGAAVTAAAGAYWGAIVGFALIGLGKPAFDSGIQAYVADRTPYERRARMLSVLELTWAGGLLVGAPAAGWLIARAGWEAPFWVIAGLSAVAVLLAPLALDRDRGGEPTGRGRLGLTRSTRSLLFIVLLFGLAAEITFVVFGAWLEDRFALSLTALGGAAVVVGLAELAGEGSVLAFADRVGKRRMVAWGLSTLSIGYVGLAIASGSLIWGLLVLAAVFVAFEITIVSAIPLATEAAPGARTTFLAWMWVFVSAGRAVGAAVGPMLFEVGGLAVNTLVSAGLSLVALGVLTWGVREQGRGPERIGVQP